jgi:hypothetical protein
MRRRASARRKGLIAAGAIVLALVLAMGISTISSRSPPPAPPEALEHIARKNRTAAAVAAANQRAESAASTNAAETLLEAGEAANRSANAL